MAPRVALVSGGWGQNIGNAFFNLGGRYVLERVFGSEGVQYIQDQPGYRTLHNKLRGNPKNYVDFVRRTDIDYIVLQGPVLNSWMRANWEQTFKALNERNVKVMLLSAAFFKFTDSEISSVRGFLEEFPPAVVVTRDHRSYDIIKDWLPGVPKYSGIDSGFFLNRVFTPFSTVGPAYVAVTFDRYPEPTISPTKLDDQRFNVSCLKVGEDVWYLGVPKVLQWTSRRSKIWAYLGDLGDRRSLPASIGKYDIIRMEHRFFPHMTYKIYRQPNALASDEPWTYLNVYANAEFTLSDRVHACVATLAFGGKAMLFTPSPRASLFDSVGALRIRAELTAVDLSYLAEQQQNLVAWLKEHV